MCSVRRAGHKDLTVIRIVWPANVRRHLPTRGQGVNGSQGASEWIVSHVRRQRRVFFNGISSYRTVLFPDALTAVLRLHRCLYDVVNQLVLALRGISCCVQAESASASNLTPDSVSQVLRITDIALTVLLEAVLVAEEAARNAQPIAQLAILHMPRTSSARWSQGKQRALFAVGTLEARGLLLCAASALDHDCMLTTRI